MSSKKKSILAVIVIISLLLIILAGYTFSKYFSSVTGKATAEIAAWSFKADAGKENSTLNDIKLVPTNGTKTVLTLLKDVTLTEYVNVTASRNIEFDLQNYTISGSQSALIVNYGTIEINDNSILHKAEAIISLYNIIPNGENFENNIIKYIEEMNGKFLYYNNNTLIFKFN